MIQDILAFLNRGHARSIKAKKHILASFGLKGISIAISLILVPLTIEYLNPTKFGIWITISYIVSWFNVFDIGLGHGMRNKLAEAMANGKTALAKKYVSTTYALLFLLMAGVYLMFTIAYPFIDWAKLLNAPPELTAEISKTILAVFSLFALQFVIRLIGTVILAMQLPALNNLINTAGSFLSLIGILVLMQLTHNSLFFAATLFSSTTLILMLLATFWFFSGKFRQFSPSLKAVDFSCTKNLLGLGAQFFIIQIAAIVVFSTDHIIISRLFSPEQVTPYHVAFKYFNVWVVAFSIVTTPLWSAYTEAYTKKETGWIKSINKKLLVGWVGIVVIAGIMLLLSQPLYKLWVGDKVSISFLLSAVMAGYVIISCFNQVFATFINATSKIKLQLYIAIFAAVINIPLSIYFAKNLGWGIAGVMLATIATMLPDTLLMPVQFKKLLNQTARGIWNK